MLVDLHLEPSLICSKFVHHFFENYISYYLEVDRRLLAQNIIKACPLYPVSFE